MGIINILDKSVAELIAAGEVIERPASIVKELVENSIDAHATAITVEIKNGGTTYIRIADNGCGIMREDVPLAFVRHATSKVKNENDLNSIGTLGFRGEALASVAAVAKVEILTRTENELDGTVCTVQGGECGEVRDAGCPKGTTLIIRDLFYNTPARMKFLKKDITEANAVAAIIDRMALSNPGISFKFVRDGKQQLLTPGDGKQLSAIYAVYGNTFADSLIKVDYRLGGVTVKGYISKPHTARPNRSMQTFFINGRNVKTRTAMAAVEQACKGSVMAGKFPACILNISINRSLVDVNVHPAKTEVRFSDDRPVFEAVYHACKSALDSGDTPPNIELEKTVPSGYSGEQRKLEENKRADIINTRLESNDRVENNITNGVIKQGVNVKYESFDYNKHNKKANVNIKEIESIVDYENSYKPLINQAGNLIIDNSKLDIFPEDDEEDSTNSPANISGDVKAEMIDTGAIDFKIIGQAFNTYIIVQCENEIVLIDKHAAHERILYEKIKKDTKAFSQMLLTPVMVTLDKKSYGAVLENIDLLENQGIEVEDFGSGAVLMRSAPSYVDEDGARSLLIEIAQKLANMPAADFTPEKLDWLYHSMACRSAVKAGDYSGQLEMQQLAKDVLSNKDIRHCPHGRPVCIVLEKKQLERQFGRIQ